MKKTILWLMITISTTINASEFTESKTDCNNNIGRGCHVLGYIYWFEKNDKQRGIKAYKKACSLGYTKSCLAMGNIHNKQGNSKLEEQYLQKACDAGSDLGCQLLGNKYLEQKKNREAIPLLKRGCNSSTLEENIKQEACRDLEEIANTVVKVNTDDFEACLMNNKFIGVDYAAKKCAELVPTPKESSGLSEKNQKAMNKCLDRVPLGISGNIANAICAQELGLKTK